MRAPQMNDPQDLNVDAIYAGMAWQREYAETPQGQEEFKTYLDERDAKPELHDILTEEASEAGCILLSFPKVKLSDQQIEEIYPGEAVSVHLGIAFARNVIWGSPDFATAILQGAFCEIKQRTHSDNKLIIEAMSRFIADRAN